MISIIKKAIVYAPEYLGIKDVLIVGDKIGAIEDDIAIDMGESMEVNIIDGNDKIVEEVKYTLAYSIFDNYDVEQVLLQVDGKNIETVSKKDLP